MPMPSSKNIKLPQFTKYKFMSLNLILGILENGPDWPFFKRGINEVMWWLSKQRYVPASPATWRPLQLKIHMEEGEELSPAVDMYCDKSLHTTQIKQK